MLNRTLKATKDRGGSPYKPPSTAHFCLYRLAAGHAHIDLMHGHPLSLQNRLLRLCQFWGRETPQRRTGFRAPAPRVVIRGEFNPHMPDTATGQGCYLLRGQCRISLIIGHWQRFSDGEKYFFRSASESFASFLQARHAHCGLWHISHWRPPFDADKSSYRRNT